jgi:hypothetical protein
MLVKNQKGAKTKLCDVATCSEELPLLLEAGRVKVANPANAQWLGVFVNGKQLDFCPLHAPVVVDLLGAHANLCRDALERLAEMSGVKPTTPETPVSSVATRPSNAG